MKTYFFALFLLPFLYRLCCAAALPGQDEPRPARHTSFIESRQGNHPDEPDIIGHASVSRSDSLMCMLVGVYDETHQASTACVVEFRDKNAKYTLTSGQSMQSPADGELFLECAGQVPRRCMVEVNPPGK